MRMGEVFGGEHLKSADLQGRRVVVTIERVSMVKYEDGAKPVLHFVGKDKGLVLNKTNANILTDVFGTDESDEWVGKRILIYVARVQYQGKMVDGLRVEAAPRDPKAPPLPSPPVEDDDDSAPF